MPLAPGQTLTHYEILGPLGAGGMGEVYRARDTRLEREVAIKVLPEHFADDLDRMKRFEREAKTLASLHHPNVASIFGIDQVGDTCFIAMELVEGEDLAARLARGPLPIDEAIDVCRQIAEGLEAAHEAGVVHRDLKPANVRITHEGIVKILDFGLAKSMHPKVAQAGTTSASSDSFLVTEEGLVLGTPTYMSPEQARGKPLDRRTDIWAFGCVLYECSSGERAFAGDSFTDVAAAIVGSEPAWDRLPALPAPVASLLRRCLEKDPRQRLRDAGEARIVLEGRGSGARMALDASSTGGGSATAHSRGRFGGRVLAVTALAAAGLGALGTRVLLSDETVADGVPRPVRCVALYDESSLLDRVALTDIAGLLEVSADGGRLLTRTRRGLFVRTLDSLDTIEVPSVDGTRVNHAVWSGDGSELVYALGTALYRVELPGLKSREIASLDYEVWAMACLGDTVVFQDGATGQLVQVPLRGGRPAPFLDGVPEGLEIVDLRSLHGSERFLALCNDAAGRWTIAVVGRDGIQDLLDVEVGARLPCYLPSGHILFERGSDESSIWAVPFDMDALRVTDEPTRALEGRAPTTSADGSVFYLATGDPGVERLAWVSEEGDVDEFGDEHASVRHPQLSARGSRIVFSPVDSSQVWSHDVARGTAVRVATLESSVGPVWVFANGSVGFHTPDSAFLLPREPGREPEPFLPSKDGERVRVCSIDAGDTRALVFEIGTRRLLLQELEDGRPRGEPIALRESVTGRASLAPTGDWYAFSSDYSGARQHYLSRYPNGPDVWPLGHEADRVAFGPDGDELVYIDREEVVWRMDFTPGEPPVFGEPKRLFDLRTVGLEEIVLHRWPGQERFLATRRLRKGRAQLVMLENWSPR